VKVEDVFEDARSVGDPPDVLPLGFAFGLAMVGEAGDSVTTQTKLALGTTHEECVHASSVGRDECVCSVFLSSLLF